LSSKSKPNLVGGSGFLDSAGMHLVNLTPAIANPVFNLRNRNLLKKEFEFWSLDNQLQCHWLGLHQVNIGPKQLVIWSG